MYNRELIFTILSQILEASEFLNFFNLNPSFQNINLSDLHSSV
jgi:hypothetical protein